MEHCICVPICNQTPVPLISTHFTQQKRETVDNPPIFECFATAEPHLSKPFGTRWCSDEQNVRMCKIIREALLFIRHTKIVMNIFKYLKKCCSVEGFGYERIGCEGLLYGWVMLDFKYRVLDICTSI